MNKDAWDQASGVSTMTENVNYFAEALKSPSNLVILMCLFCLSLMTGLIGGLPLILFALVFSLAGDMLLNAALSSSATFQYAQNRRLEAVKRERIRRHLLGRIQDKAFHYRDPVSDLGSLLIKAESNEHRIGWEAGAAAYHDSYYQMRQNLENLRELARNSGTSLTPGDIDKLDEVTLDYLRLVYALFSLNRRMETERSSGVEEKLKDIKETLEQTGIPLPTRRQLQSSMVRLTKTLERRQQYPTTAMALSARLLHMSEDFEELYHQLNSDPSASTVTGFLAEMTEKLSVEKELSSMTDWELSTEYSTLPSEKVTDLDQYRKTQIATSKQRN